MGVIMETNFDRIQEKSELEKLATKKVLKLKAFYTHTFIYSIGIIFFIAKEYFGVPFNFLPLKYINGFVMCIWTTAYLFSAIEIFVSYAIFGEEWEQRKLKSILKKNRKYKNENNHGN
jgi:hypothetical protein